MFRFEGALMFASFTYFRSCLIAKSGLDPFRLAKQKRKHELKNSEASQLSKPVLSANNLNNMQPFSSSSTNLGSIAQQSQAPISFTQLQFNSAAANNLTQSGDSFQSNRVNGNLKENQRESLNKNAVGVTLSNSQKTLDDVGNSKSSMNDCASAEQTEELSPWPAAILIGTQTVDDNDDNESFPQSVTPGEREPSYPIQVTHLILDCSGWAYIDDTALTLLVDVSVSLFLKQKLYT